VKKKIKDSGHLIDLIIVSHLCVQVFLVGHDWGAMVAWHLCMIRPDLVKALVNLSVVFQGQHPTRPPVDSIKAVFGEDHYIVRFQVCKSMILIIWG
jgi:pimeloyl-ACP methyl ester carboxylesterase